MKLYNLSTGTGLGGFKVGGDVGLGLATFGYFYFLLCFVIYWFVFYLFDAVTCFFKGNITISIFTLTAIYDTYFLKFQVGNGLISQTSYVFWGFWWVVIWQTFALKLIKLIKGQ